MIVLKCKMQIPNIELQYDLFSLRNVQMINAAFTGL